jgi:hypothetical protein
VCFFSKYELFSEQNKKKLHIFGTPIELGGTLAETICKKKTTPSMFVISKYVNFKISIKEKNSFFLKKTYVGQLFRNSQLAI